MQRAVFSCMIIFSALMLTSCSSSKPSDTFIKESYIERSGSGILSKEVELVSFKIINGVASEENEVKYYTVAVEAIHKALIDFPDARFYKGKLQRWDCEMTFMKADNGWVLVGFRC